MTSRLASSALSHLPAAGLTYLRATCRRILAEFGASPKSAYTMVATLHASVSLRTGAIWFRQRLPRRLECLISPPTTT
jgi:hypothetical protein